MKIGRRSKTQAGQKVAEMETTETHRQAMIVLQIAEDQCEGFLMDQ